MTMRVRAFSMLLVALAIMGLASCDHYVCGSGALFGASTCTAGTPSLGSGSTGSSTSAFAFAVDEAGTIDGYTLNTTANTFEATSGYTGPTIPTNELGYGMAVAQKQYLYAAFIGTGQIYGWTIGSGGGLTAISGSPFSAPYLIGIGSSQGPQDMIVNPAGTLLFVDDVSVEGIYVYSIGSGGALTAVSGSPFSVPFFPANMATDGQGKYLYVTQDLGGTNSDEVAAFSINSSTGALTPVVGSPFAYNMWQVQGDPTGDYLIGTTSGSNGDYHLYLFSITQSGANAGAISEVQAG
jgi:6-phosphogluconolactonase